MGDCDGIYLYCDLDGTLLNDDKRVSADDAAAIADFVSRGGRFGVATGRVPGIIGEIERELPVNAPCILYNGAGLYDLSQKRFLAMHPVDRKACAQIAQKALHLYEDICIQIFTDSAIYEINANQRDDPQTLVERIPTVKCPLEEVPDIFLKFILSLDPVRLCELIQKLDLSKMPESLSSFQSSSVYLEFVSKGVCKGTALGDVRARCENVQKILAVGDYENDLEMIALADIGAAPSNAIEAVKRAADIVLPVDNNHSAVARFLKQVL
ncbi:MAG TPA: HAD-IIB family hydrolase [Feifaniaceae bacterium]|nr:HAD-IIB family hydrolase [Feifaniaceae bacterium]